MQIDILKTGQANFLELANTANGQTLTAEQMTIGAPVVYSDDTDGNPRNTQVTISALPGSLEFKGSQTLRYTRLSLADLLADYEFQSVEGSTIEDVLAKVVSDLGLVESDVTLVETVMPDWEDEMIDGETSPLTLRAVEGSYLYVGDGIVTVVEPIDGRQRFAEMYAVADLDGFVAPIE